MTADVHAAERWYGGMARAAHERNLTIQYCLPSATDILISLSYPSVVQARASTDYVDLLAFGGLAYGGSGSTVLWLTFLGCMWGDLGEGPSLRP